MTAVIVGGGIVGLAVAFELALRGHAPLVLERGRRGGEATWAAAGMLAPVSEVEIEDAVLIDLALDSLRRYPEFISRVERIAGGSCAFRTDGTLWVALNHDQLQEIEHLAETMRLRSLSSTRLSASEILEREPHLSRRVQGGLLVEQDLQVDPRALLRCLEEGIRRSGGEVRHGSEAIAVEVQGARRLVVHIDRDGARSQVAGACVVACAGAWTHEALRLPIEPLGIRPVKGQLLRLRGERLLRHVIRNPDCYLVPREDGELLLGATMEEQGFDAAPTAGAVLDLLRAGWQVLPGLYDLELAEVSVGFRPAVADHLPLIGSTEVDGLFVATGHFRQGVLLAPATAYYLAELIETGRMPAALVPFSPARLSAGRVPS